MKVIGIGDNVVDDYIHIRTMFPGGNALNFSVYTSMLGCHSAYLGVFGNDVAAKHVQRTLLEMGVDTSHCRSVEGPNGRAIITIENGERIFISSNEGGISKSVPMEFVFDDMNYLQAFSIVHTSAYSYLDSYLSRLQLLNSLVSYDFSDDFDTDHALSLCQHIDIAFFSCADWTEERTMDLLENAVNQGCNLALATRGSREAILFEGRSWFRQAPHAVVPKDTLGAGDAFISGFLVSYAGSKAANSIQPDSLIESSLEKAAIFAAEICQVQGAFGHELCY
jgi:fructoselysine 6-kinase